MQITRSSILTSTGERMTPGGLSTELMENSESCPVIFDQKEQVFRYPMEMHIVHKKMGVEVSEALKMTEGLAITGFFFEVHLPGSVIL